MRVFISYSHKDEVYRNELDAHLALLKRQRLIDVWTDHCIRPGEDFEPAIAAALKASELILLLISSDFMRSDYCYGVEMAHAMTRHVQKTATVVPILLRACDWKSAPFGRIKSLPTDGLPVDKWRTWDDAFFDITQQLRNLIEHQVSQQPLSTAGATSAMSDRDAQVAPVTASGAPRMMRSSQVALPRQFTDEDRHDFLVNIFKYVQTYFEGSLHELQARNQGITTRLTALSPEAFKAIVFRDGKRIAGCYIRISSSYGNGIAYSGNENASDNSHNEMMTVEADKHLLYLTAGMTMLRGGNHQGRLTDEGAAEHLWSMFISRLQ